MNRILKPDRQLYGTINLPASKNISNRLLVLQFLHPERITLKNISPADDTVLLETLLHKIRQYMEGGRKKILTLDIGNSNTVLSYLVALLSAIPGSYVLRGDKSSARRSVQILVNGLMELGADIQFIENPGYLPLFIKGRNLFSRELTIKASESNLQLSALLLVSTVFTDGIRIVLEKRADPGPYVDMTCRILEISGFPTIRQEEMIRVFPGKNTKVAFNIEPDWNSASYWYGM